MDKGEKGTARYNVALGSKLDAELDEVANKQGIPLRKVYEEAKAAAKKYLVGAEGS